VGALSAVPGLVIGLLLSRNGIVQRWSAFRVIVTSCGAVLVLRVLVPDVTLYACAGISAVVTPSVYGDDLWMFLREGKWWWLKGRDESNEVEREAKARLIGKPDMSKAGARRRTKK
jgi:hypothetical protein